MPQIAPPSQGAAPPHATSPAVPPLKPPPAAAAPAAKGSISPVVWIVALAVGAMGIGAMFVLLLIVGVVALVMLGNKSGKSQPYANQPALQGGSAGSAPSYTSGSSDYWSQSQPGSGSASGYERWRDKGSASQPAASQPAGDAYREPPQDSDWQLNLPEYQRDAIRELNQQRDGDR